MSETGTWGGTDNVGCPFSQGCQHGIQRGVQHVLTKALPDAHHTPGEEADPYHSTWKLQQGLLQTLVHNEHKPGLNLVVQSSQLGFLHITVIDLEIYLQCGSQQVLPG